MKIRIPLAAAALALSLSTGPVAIAGEQSGHGHGHNMPAAGMQDEVQVKGVLNSIDSAAQTINVTHEPVESLGWPAMTMALPVTRRVDLSTVKPGDNVRFTLKQGRDKKFRVTHIEPGT